jgi:hypothetical protein
MFLLPLARLKDDECRREAPNNEASRPFGQKYKVCVRWL